VVDDFGAAVGTAVVATAIALSPVVITPKAPEGNVADPAGSKPVASKAEFEYPSELVGNHDPDGDGWQGVKGNNESMLSAEPEKYLVGPPPSYRSMIVLPVKHWIELKFPGRIVDGPGDDIILIEWDASGEQAGVYLTDGTGKVHPLGIARAGSSRQPSRTEIGFDISDTSPPFEPCAIRIVGIKSGGWTNGFDLGSIRARIRRSDNK